MVAVAAHLRSTTVAVRSLRHQRWLVAEALGT